MTGRSYHANTPSSALYCFTSNESIASCFYHQTHRMPFLRYGLSYLSTPHINGQNEDENKSFTLLYIGIWISSECELCSSLVRLIVPQQRMKRPPQSASRRPSDFLTRCAQSIPLHLARLRLRTCLLLICFPVLAASNRPEVLFHVTFTRWYSGLTGSSRIGADKRASTCCNTTRAGTTAPENVHSSYLRKPHSVCAYLPPLSV